MDNEEQARASHMMTVQDEAQNRMQPLVDLTANAVIMLRQQTESMRTPQGLDAPLTIAIDFGTTNTAVAFWQGEEGSRPRIMDIKNYPDDPINRAGVSSSQVPTESWYSDISKTTGPYFKVETNRTNTSSDTMSDYEDDIGSDHSQSMTDDGLELVNPAANDMQALCWGYGVRSKLAPDMPRNNYNHVTQSKLLLDNIEDTVKIDTGHLKRRAKTTNGRLRTQEELRMRSSHERTMKTRSGLLVSTAKILRSSPPPIQDKSNNNREDNNELRKVVRRLKRLGFIKNEIEVIVHFMTQVMRHVKRELTYSYNVSCSTPIRYVLSVPVTWKPSALLAMQNATKIAIETSGLGIMDDLFLVAEPEAAANYLVQKTKDLKVCTQMKL